MGIQYYEGAVMKKKSTYTLSEEAIRALRIEAARRVVETGEEVSASAVLEELILKNCSLGKTLNGARKTDRTSRAKAREDFDFDAGLDEIPRLG